MPSEAATDYALVRDLVTGGMSCIRINCAHDGPEQWSAMIANLRAVEAEVGRTCRVIMDLAGPKLRTGPLRPGPRVLSVKPRRDERGRVLARAKIRLTASPEADESVALPVVPVIAGWIARLRVGDHLELEDARGRRRSLVVIESDRAGCVAETAQTIFFETGLPIRRRHGRRGRGGEAAGQIGELPALAAPIVVAPGDALVLTRSLESGHPAVRGDNGHVVEPARIGCTLAEVFDAVRPGEPIWFDDGKIGGVIESAAPDHMVVRITHARATGERLGAEKGINLPETGLAVAALTVKDEQDLRFVAAQADAVGLSFVREAWQVDHLRRRLIELEAPDLGLVLKIETRRAFECLPQLLLAAMQFPRAAVMIARGDLAVECGFERLAEIQEEILWIVEAAHLPVIWATQVLESLAAKGRATRAEITDAAMGARAECVMLNKGPYVAEAVRALDDILRRMQDHQQKKRSLLRRLRSWSTHPNGAQGEPQP
jgi:pyruvate kinase